MFKNKTFYNQHIKKAIIAFGTIFNNINIERKDSDGVVNQSLRVPLAYSTKQKFLSRIRAVPDEQFRDVQLILPRMGFEITSLTYDPSRKISPIQKNRAVGAGDDTNTVRQSFVSTPYNMQLSLYVFAKNQEDALQIVEQIFPYFNPDFNVTVNELPELGIKRDIKITLDSVDYEDQYEGDFSQRQSIIWTLNFNMRINFFGYVGSATVIKESIARLYTDINLDALKQVKVSGAVGSDGTINKELTPADDYDYITNILESFEGEDVGWKSIWEIR